MTPEEQEVEQMLLAASKGAVVDKLKSPALPQAPGEVGSFVRGVGNSALMGYQPQVAGAISTINPWSNQNYSEARNEAADLNEAAWQAHPGYYGTGTALGTAASLLVPGAVLKGIRLAGEAVMAGRGAKAAEAIQAARAAKATEYMDQGMSAADAYKAASGAPIPRPSGPTNILQQMGSAGRRGALPSIPATGAARGASTVVNPGDKISQAEDTSPPGMFGTLADWLNVAQNSNNPKVQSQAAQTLQSMQQSNDPNVNRQLAMNLQTTATGRAAMNEDSPLNDESQYKYT